MEKTQTNADVMNQVLDQAQNILNKYFLVFETTVHHFDEVIQYKARHLALPECKAMKQALLAHNQTCMENIDRLFNFVETLALLKKKLTKSLQYFYPDGAPTIVKYHSGDPWNLMLKHTPCKNKEIERTLMEMYKSKQLESISDPDNFDVVCVHDGKSFHRAIIIDTMPNDRLTVLNVDKNYHKVVLVKNVYELPSVVMDIPIQVMKCSLLPENEELRSLWNKDAADLLLSVASESTISVVVDEKIKAEIPPIFSVKMTSERNGVQIDVNQWLINTVLPALKLWKNKSPSFEEVNALFPFDENTASESIKSVPIGRCRSYRGGKKKSKNPIKTEPIEEKSDESNTSNGGRHNKSDVSNTSSGGRDNKSDESNISNVAVRNSSCDSDPEVTNMFSDPSAKAAIFLPNGNEDVTVIKHHDNDYQPKDESEYCYLFLRNKRCWKKNCRKLHKTPSGKWTDDKINTFCVIINKVRLPKVFQEITFKVAEISSANSFYVYLHPDYSSVGDSNDKETLVSLQQDMNTIDNVKHYKSYPVDPSLGEILLVHDDNVGYKRAKVVETFDQHVYVFLVDFGVFDTVPLANVRKIEQQFLHFPAQAIYTTLENLIPVPGKENQAKAFLKLKLKGKIFRAKILRSNVPDSELSAEVYLDQNTSLSAVLLQKGYCKALS